MAELDKLTTQHFAGHVGEEFRVATDSGVIALRLRSVEGTGRSWDPEGREAFSIFFGGPNGDALPQRIYHIEHDVLGGLDIFLVPIGPDEEGHRYEAVFT